MSFGLLRRAMGRHLLLHLTNTDETPGELFEVARILHGFGVRSCTDLELNTNLDASGAYKRAAADQATVRRCSRRIPCAPPPTATNPLGGVSATYPS